MYSAIMKLLLEGALNRRWVSLSHKYNNYTLMTEIFEGTESCW